MFTKLTRLKFHKNRLTVSIMSMTNAKNLWNMLKICLFGQITKQPLSNFEP